jgi:hypothetical protein
VQLQPTILLQDVVQEELLECWHLEVYQISTIYWKSFQKELESQQNTVICLDPTGKQNVES